MFLKEHLIPVVTVLGGTVDGRGFDLDDFLAETGFVTSLGCFNVVLVLAACLSGVIISGIFVLFLDSFLGFLVSGSS